MKIISILANTVRPFVDHRLDDIAFGEGTFSWQDSVNSWKAGPGEVMTVENLHLPALQVNLNRGCPEPFILNNIV